MQRPFRAAILRWKSNQLDNYVARAQQARSVQKQVLLDKVRAATDSEFGKRYGFQSIHDVASFRRQLPITTYEDYRPFIDRVMQGDVEAMFARGTKVLMFAMTSGTTSEPKRLPVTAQFYKEYKRSWQLWGTGVYRDYQTLFDRQTLQLSSDWQIEDTPSGAPCGNISGLAATSRPIYMRHVFSLPASVIKIRDFAAKHYTSLRLSMASDNVGMIITANPSTLVEFARRANDDSESIIRDIHDGGLNSNLDVPDEVRRSLKSRLRPNPKRARELVQLRSQEGALLPKDFWPKMKMIATWTGGSVGVYLPQLNDFYGEVNIRDHGISASEGRMSIPLKDGTPDGMLDYAHHFYEFIPESEHGSPDPTVLEAHELEPDKNYFILLTTSAGLYRYDIHDVVRCTGFEGEAPVLRFLNKGRNFSSITGEKLSEHQVVAAVTKSFKQLDLPPCGFTLAPTMGVKPRYELLLESALHLQFAQQLASLVQENLTAINEEYAEKCLSGRIEPIAIHEITPGTWATIRNNRSRARGNYEEFKQPCLVSSLGYADSLPTPTVGERVAS